MDRDQNRNYIQRVVKSTSCQIFHCFYLKNKITSRKNISRTNEKECTTALKYNCYAGNGHIRCKEWQKLTISSKIEIKIYLRTVDLWFMNINL